MNSFPTPFVLVWFLPAASAALPGGSGTTEQTDKFAIGEDGQNPGFPAGEYWVTFSPTLVNGKPHRWPVEYGLRRLGRRSGPH